MSELAVHTSSILARAAALHPEREAIAWQRTRLTYGELDIATARLAIQLERDGLRPGARVAMLGRNSVAFAVGLLALARNGFVAVPLNWRLSDRALAATLAGYRPEGLLFGGDLAPAAGALRDATPSIRTAVCLEEEPAAFTSEEEARAWTERRRESPKREDLFAYISTGGTEGVSKGVPVTNGMLEAGLIALLASESVRSSDVTMVLPQMFHNPHLYVIPPLLTGGRLVVPEMASFDPELVLRTIESEGVTRFLGVATMMAYLLDAQERIGADVSSLRVISYGGAPFAEPTVKRLMRTFDCGLLQLYGQTETSVLVSTLTEKDHREALADEGLRHRLVSAGQPVPLVQVRVVDDQGSECPRDRATVGEILVRSPSVMSGYFENPTLSAERLVDGWCHTGDLGTWDRDGYLYIVDRRNDMIISGGENVFPSAVEAVIREADGVEDAVVIGVPHEVWGEVVTAVVLARPGQTVAEEQIASLCSERLARYMRPRTIHLVQELPKNASGKVLRGEIRKRFAQAGGGSGARQVGAV